MPCLMQIMISCCITKRGERTKEDKINGKETSLTLSLESQALQTLFCSLQVQFVSKMICTRVTAQLQILALGFQPGWILLDAGGLVFIY